MSMQLLIRGHCAAQYVLDSTCFSHTNYGAFAGGNTTLSTSTPLGVLGGSVAGISAVDYTVYPCTMTMMPAGLFMNDAAGAAYDNSTAVASNKITVLKGLSSVEVDVYETNSKTGPGYATLSYAHGEKLYSSDQGLLTNETSTSAVVIGVVTKVPSVSNPLLGLDMRI